MTMSMPSRVVTMASLDDNSGLDANQRRRYSLDHRLTEPAG
jgi:hypothetical protein